MSRPIALLTLLAASLASPAGANIPASYWACEEHAHFEVCQLPGNRFGACLFDTLCDDDDPATPVNECLICRDPCGGTKPDVGCVQEISGEQGVCKLAEGCVDNPVTSFNECNLCVPGRAPAVKADEGGCALTDAGAAAPWALVLLALGLQVRRRRSERRQPGQ